MKISQLAIFLFLLNSNFQIFGMEGVEKLFNDPENQYNPLLKVRKNIERRDNIIDPDLAPKLDAYRRNPNASPKESVDFTNHIETISENIRYKLEFQSENSKEVVKPEEVSKYDGRRYKVNFTNHFANQRQLDSVIHKKIEKQKTIETTLKNTLYKIKLWKKSKKLNAVIKPEEVSRYNGKLYQDGLLTLSLFFVVTKDPETGKITEQWKTVKRSFKCPAINPLIAYLATKNDNNIFEKIKNHLKRKSLESLNDNIPPNAINSRGSFEICLVKKGKIENKYPKKKVSLTYNNVLAQTIASETLPRIAKIFKKIKQDYPTLEDEIINAQDAFKEGRISDLEEILTQLEDKKIEFDKQKLLRLVKKREKEKGKEKFDKLETRLKNHTINNRIKYLYLYLTNRAKKFISEEITEEENKLISETITELANSALELLLANFTDPENAQETFNLLMDFVEFHQNNAIMLGTYLSPDNLQIIKSFIELKQDYPSIQDEISLSQFLHALTKKKISELKIIPMQVAQESKLELDRQQKNLHALTQQEKDLQQKMLELITNFEKLEREKNIAKENFEKADIIHKNIAYKAKKYENLEQGATIILTELVNQLTRELSEINKQLQNNTDRAKTNQLELQKKLLEQKLYEVQHYKSQATGEEGLLDNSAYLTKRLLFGSWFARKE